MKNSPIARSLASLALCFLCAVTFPVRAHPSVIPDSFSAGFDMYNWYRLEENIPEDQPFRWGSPQRSLYQAALVLSLDLGWSTAGDLCVILDSGELSEETISDDGLENDRTDDYFIREGYFETSFLDSRGLALKIGRQYLVSGEGYILDDFLLGGRVRLDLNRLLRMPLHFYGTVAQVRGESLFSEIRSVHPLGIYERLMVAVSWLHDAEGFLAELLQDLGSRYPGGLPWSRIQFDSEADIFWLTLAANKNLRFLSLSAVGILEGGNLSLSGRGRSGGEFRSSIPCLGYLLDLAADKNLTEDLSLEVFWLMASGEDELAGALQEGELLGSFLSIAPYIRRTNIFFNGGISEPLYHREFNLAGHTARGFCAPGLSSTWFLTDNLWLEGKFAYLFSIVSPPGFSEGRVYGLEWDLMAYWQWGKHVLFSAEADLFEPGSFFESPSVPDPDPAYRVMGGIAVMF